MARFFGQYLLEKGALTREQLLEALAKQRSKVEKIGELAVRHGYLKEADVEKIRNEQQRTDLFFGQLAVKLGYLTDAQVGELLNVQRSNHVYLGEILVDLKFMTKEQVDHELKLFKEEEGEDRKGAVLAVPKDFPYQAVLSVIADATEKHFRRVSDMLVKISGVDQEKGETDNPYISVFIDLKGDIKGSLLLRLSKDAAIHVVKQFAKNQVPFKEDDEFIKDAVAEFFNILAGNLLSKFMEIGKSCDITVPRTFFKSEQKALSIGNGSTAFTIPLATTEGFSSISFIPAH